MINEIPLTFLHPDNQAKHKTMKHEMQITSSEYEGKIREDYLTTNRSDAKEHIISPLGVLFIALTLFGFIALYHATNTIYINYLIKSYMIISLVVMFKAFEYPKIKSNK